MVRRPERRDDREGVCEGGDDNADLCARYGMGVEIEMDGTALSDPEYHKRYVEYLSIGAERGYMNGVKMYYQDGCPGLLYRCVKSGNARNRLLYDLTYKYAKRQLSPALGTIEGNEITISKDSYYDGKVFAGGVECTELSVVISPNYGTVAISQAGDLRYVPIKGYVGEDSFVLTVSDGFSSAKIPFTVKVTATTESDG